MSENYPVDIVITWVDGNDPEWQKEKAVYSPNNQAFKAASSNIRFRDWDNLQYIFRGIEQFMPWVNRVFFITWGHLPEWLNTECPKLRIVRHEEYIPSEYLPTFNSNVIELNLHRILDLSERFINFNDDTFVIGETQKSDFFENGLTYGIILSVVLCLLFSVLIYYALINHQIGIALMAVFFLMMGFAETAMLRLIMNITFLAVFNQQCIQKRWILPKLRL